MQVNIVTFDTNTEITTHTLPLSLTTVLQNKITRDIDKIKLNS